MVQWTCVVAEDEALLREALVQALQDCWPELTLLAICEDGSSALEQISQHQPQVAFLDIRMPGLSGLEVAAALLEASPRTQVVFVTAYDQYALHAFDSGAMDYLLKPVSHERLLQTRQRLESRATPTALDPNALNALLAQLQQHTSSPKAPPLAWLTASAGQETRLILIEDVVYFQSDSKYTVVMTAQGESLLRKPLRELLDTLDPNLFKQIHRSTIVNIKAIAAISRDDTGKGIVRLKNRPETLTVSTPFMHLFRHM
jgi:DNA-binding LytR/AlgR family response regulator